MNWYIVILTSMDWYTLYENTVIVKASNPQEATNKALEGRAKHIEVQTWFDCGTRKPKEG